MLRILFKTSNSTFLITMAPANGINQNALALPKTVPLVWCKSVHIL